MNYSLLLVLIVLFSTMAFVSFAVPVEMEAGETSLEDAASRAR